MTQTVDRAKVFTSTPGTGTVTLGLAVLPYQTWSAAGAINGTVYPYLIEDGSAWETGYGTYSSGGGTMTRTLRQSSTGSLLNLSGSATIAVEQGSSDGLCSAGAVTNPDETTASSSYTDLATFGPSVTLVTGTTAEIWFSALTYRNSTGTTSYMTIAVSGATTIAAADVNASAYAYALANAYAPLSRCIIMTGLTPGSNTFTAKYKNDSSATVHFQYRTLVVRSST
jgi:hypothetical protein